MAEAFDEGRFRAQVDRGVARARTVLENERKVCARQRPVGAMRRPHVMTGVCVRVVDGAMAGPSGGAFVRFSSYGDCAARRADLDRVLLSTATVVSQVVAGVAWRVCRFLPGFSLFGGTLQACVPPAVMSSGVGNVWCAARGVGCRALFSLHSSDPAALSPPTQLMCLIVTRTNTGWPSS